MKNLKIHTENLESDCRFGHNTFYFIKDVSKYYPAFNQGKKTFECVCLDCGLKSKFQMNNRTLKRIIYPNTERYSDADVYKTIEELEKAKKDIDEVPGLTEEDVIETYNSKLKKTKHLRK